MKRKIYVLLAMAAILILLACEESADPGLSEQARDQQILNRLDENERIGYEMFDILSERMPSDSLNKIKKSAPSKEMFINLIARQTDGYFEEVIASGLATFDITDAPMPFAGEAEITLKGLASAQTAGAVPFDVIGEYSKQLLNIAKEQAASGRKDWIMIESEAEPGANEPRPSESLSLNFTKVEMLSTIPHSIIMNAELTDDEMLAQVNDILNEFSIPPVAIALLLPAVQKLQSPGTEAQPFDDAMNVWLDGPITQAIGGGMNRDIIRRIQAAVYLAALHTIILDTYEGTNQDVASLSVIHARYRAAVIMGAEALWEN